MVLNVEIPEVLKWTDKNQERRRVLGGSSQVLVRITPIHKPWKGHLEGVPQTLGDKN